MKTTILRILQRGVMTLALVVGVIAAKADEPKWYLIANNTERLPMAQVGMLVAADNDTDFSILDLKGNVLLEGVRLVTFEQLSSSEVVDLTLPHNPQNLLRSLVDGELTLMGAKGLVEVYSLSGAKLMQVKTQGGETRLNVSSLRSGTYMVRCGEQAFKFIKK